MGGAPRAFGATLKALREEVRISQDDLARRYNALSGQQRTQSWVSAIERGIVRVSPPNLRMLARALGVEYTRLAIAAGYAEEERAGDDLDEEIAADLMAFARARPDLMATLRRMKTGAPPQVYRQAMRIVHRFLIDSIETAREAVEEEPPEEK